MQFVWPLVEILIVQVWENIKGVISGAIDVITGIIDFFAALFTGNWSALWESVKKIISGAVKFLWNLINLYFIGRILGIARNFVGIFGNVIRGGWNTIRGLFSGGLGAVRNLVSTGLGAVRNTFSNIMNGLRNIVSGAFNRVRSSISTGMNNALNAVKNFFGKFKDAGRRIVTSIADGIKGAISTVTNAIKGVTQKVRNFLPFSPPKEGPMKDIMKVQWGPTIAEGILKGEDVVAEAMNRLLDHQYSFHSDVQPQKRSDSDTLLREQNELLKLLLQKDQEIIVDGDVLFKLTDKRLTSTFDLDTYLRGERV